MSPFENGFGLCSEDSIEFENNSINTFNLVYVQVVNRVRWGVGVP